jgi:AcrR family transcriptional regulator
MARTQRADLRERADALLDATAELLTAGGSRNIRIEEVADHTGVGKGTVYLHWQSRDHLLLAVGAREAATMADTVIAAIHSDPCEAAPHRYLRRHFLEAMQRPILKTIFGADSAQLADLARQSARAGLVESKLTSTNDYLGALAEHRLLRPGLDLADVDFGLQAVAYGFFAAGPLLPDDPRFTLDHRADQLAEVVRRSFEPARPPSPDRYAAAAPHVIDAFKRLAEGFRRAAYGAATD